MDKTAKFWDKLAKSFNNSDYQSDENHIKTITMIRPYLKSDYMVLDYGCATGMIAADIADDVKDVLGIDISSKMISFAEQNAADRDLKNIHFRKSSLFDPQLKEKSFDVILAFNILHLLPHAEDDIQRVGELLKPGGIFISTTACMGAKKTILSTLFKIAAKLKIIPHLNFFGYSQLESIIKSKAFLILKSEREFEGKYSHLIIAEQSGS